MSKVLEKATAHFRNQISGDMKMIEVPEWEAKIYYKPVTTLREQGKILELSQQGKAVEALVESLIVRARNEDGSRMFNTVDKVTLLNEVDPQILVRIVGQMNEVPMDEFAIGNVEKN